MAMMVLYQFNLPQMLAYYISVIFDNPDIANRISKMQWNRKELLIILIRISVDLKRYIKSYLSSNSR